MGCLLARCFFAMEIFSFHDFRDSMAAMNLSPAPHLLVMFHYWVVLYLPVANLYQSLKHHPLIVLSRPALPLEVMVEGVTLTGNIVVLDFLRYLFASENTNKKRSSNSVYLYKFGGGIRGNFRRDSTHKLTQKLIFPF